jgi:tRNA-dihydrouridine synthase A
MIGREAYHNPYFLAEIERELHGVGAAGARGGHGGFLEYVEARLAEGVRLPP